MAIETDSERAIFFELDEFAVTCAYTKAGESAPAAHICGIFDKEFLAVGLESNLELASTDPMFQCPTAQIPTGNAVGDTLVIDGTTYKARVFQPDGTGITTIVLEDQS